MSTTLYPSYALVVISYMSFPDVTTTHYRKFHLLCAFISDFHTFGDSIFDNRQKLLFPPNPDFQDTTGS